MEQLLKALVKIQEDNILKQVLISSQSKPEIDQTILDKWQGLLNLLAEILEVPSALIMKIHTEEIEVFMHNDHKDNPYESHEKAALGNGLYCETVIGKEKTLEVLNALDDPNWDHNPDIDLGMIYYLGMPIKWPDKEVFGTICILDKVPRHIQDTYKQILETIRDIIERDLGVILQNKAFKHSLVELAKSQKHYIQAEKIAALNTLISGLSHEMNTPLGVCLTSITYLEQLAGRLDQEVTTTKLTQDDFISYSDHIQEAVQLISTNLQKSIELMADLKHISSSSEVYKLSTFDFCDFLNEHIDAYSEKLKELNVKINVLCEADINVTSYRSIITQVLMHLTLNSVEHGFKEKNGGLITITLKQDNNMLRLTYEDNGTGIPDTIKTQIFEPFFTTNRLNKNTGLGLYVVQNAVTGYLRGSIQYVKSQHGAKFIIETPIDLSQLT